MVRIEKGQTYEAFTAKTGVSARGEWEAVQVRDKRNKTITIWPDNRPTGINSGDEFLVKEITAIKYGARKRPNGDWVDDVSIEAILEKTKGEGYDFDVNDFFDDKPDDADGENPFADKFKELIDDDASLPF